MRLFCHTRRPARPAGRRIEAACVAIAVGMTVLAAAGTASADIVSEMRSTGTDGINCPTFAKTVSLEVGEGPPASGTKQVPARFSWELRHAAAPGCAFVPATVEVTVPLSMSAYLVPAGVTSLSWSSLVSLHSTGGVGRPDLPYTCTYGDGSVCSAVADVSFTWDSFSYRNAPPGCYRLLVPDGPLSPWRGFEDYSETFTVSGTPVPIKVPATACAPTGEPPDDDAPADPRPPNTPSVVNPLPRFSARCEGRNAFGYDRSGRAVLRALSAGLTDARTVFEDSAAALDLEAHLRAALDDGLAKVSKATIDAVLQIHGLYDAADADLRAALERRDAAKAARDDRRYRSARRDVRDARRVRARLRLQLERRMGIKRAGSPKAVRALGALNTLNLGYEAMVLSAGMTAVWAGVTSGAASPPAGCPEEDGVIAMASARAQPAPPQAPTADGRSYPRVSARFARPDEAARALNRLRRSLAAQRSSLHAAQRLMTAAAPADASRLHAHLADAAAELARARKARAALARAIPDRTAKVTRRARRALIRRGPRRTLQRALRAFDLDRPTRRRAYRTLAVRYTAEHLPRVGASVDAGAAVTAADAAAAEMRAAGVLGR